MRIEEIQVSHVTVTELHKLLTNRGIDISRDTVQRDVRTGRLPAHTIAGIYLVEAAAAVDYVNTREPYDTLRKRADDDPSARPTHQG